MGLMRFPLELVRDLLEPEARLRRSFFSFLAFSSLTSSRISACESTATWCCCAAPAGSPGERGA
jgi:hypothetical protein